LSTAPNRIEIINEILTIDGLDKFLNKVGSDLKEKNETWLQLNLPRIMMQINRIRLLMLSESEVYASGHFKLTLVTGEFIACLLNGFGSEKMNQVMSILIRNDNLIKPEHYIHELNDALKYLSLSLQEQFQHIMVGYILQDMTDEHGKIKILSLSSFVDNSNPMRFRHHLSLMETLGLSLTLEGFVEALNHLKMADQGVDINDFEELVAEINRTASRRGGLVAYSPQDEHVKRFLGILRDRQHKRQYFVSLLAPRLFDSVLSLSDLKRLTSCLDQNLGLYDATKLKRELFASLNGRAYFQPNLVDSSTELLELMMIFSTNERPEILNKFQSRLPEFIIDTGRFNQIFETVFASSTVDSEHYDRIMSYFPDQTRTVAANSMYSFIFRACCVDDYYLVKMQGEPILGSSGNLPPEFKEGYVRSIEIRETNQMDLIGVKKKLFYVDTRLDLCFEIKLSIKEMNHFDDITSRCFKLSIESINELATFLIKTGKADFYCNPDNLTYPNTHPITVSVLDETMQKINNFISLSEKNEYYGNHCQQLCDKVRAFAAAPTKSNLEEIKEKQVDIYMHGLKQYNKATPSNKVYSKENMQFIYSLFSNIKDLGKLVPAEEPSWKRKVQEFNAARKKAKTSKTPPTALASARFQFRGKEDSSSIPVREPIKFNCETDNVTPNL
jgi:hypothetical protein